ncbi:MAG TPA: hypothetical protein VG106_02910, partial [Vicinamibacterales bacterium]|nr:hypothetical protein [Vicinamibacterales bacterium]
NFKPNDCRDPELSGSTWVINTGAACEDFGDGGYNPRMYHLAEFFAAPNAWGTGGHVGNPPSGAYQSNVEYSGWQLSNFNSGFGYGRYATYHEQAYTWYVARITNGQNLYANNPRYMPFDNNPAQGYLDAVNDDGWAYGWACDADAPNSWVKVDLYANGVKIADTMEQYAWHDSIQSEINSRCGGGTAHRWYISVPSAYFGQLITAKARDYTFRPAVSLPCVTECVR